MPPVLDAPTKPRVRFQKDIEVYSRAQGVFDRLSKETYQRAKEGGRTLTQQIFTEDAGADEYADGLDPFERMLALAGIRVNTDRRGGFLADDFAKFYETPQSRALVYEWARREWESAVTTARSYVNQQAMNAVQQRALYTSQDVATGSVINPFIDAAQVRMHLLMPAIPLDQVVAFTTPIQSDVYRAAYLTDDVNAERLRRVAEGTEVPTAVLKIADNVIRLHKFGRALEITYENARHLRVDVVALHIARMAIQTEIDRVAAVLDVMVNGDGNANSAATVYNLSTMDPAAVVGTLSVKGWLNFKMQWPAPYQMTTALAQTASVLQAMTLNMGSANVPLVNIQANSGFGSFEAINPGLRDNVAIGWISSAPALKIVGFDRRLAVEHVVEIGADIQEVARFIERQTERVVMTETEGFDIFDASAVKILNINA